MSPLASFARAAHAYRSYGGSHSFFGLRPPAAVGLRHLFPVHAGIEVSFQAENSPYFLQQRGYEHDPAHR